MSKTKKLNFSFRCLIRNSRIRLHKCPSAQYNFTFYGPLVEYTECGKEYQEEIIVKHCYGYYVAYVACPSCERLFRLCAISLNTKLNLRKIHESIMRG